MHHLHNLLREGRHHAAKPGAADSEVSTSANLLWWIRPTSREEDSGMQVGLGRQEKLLAGVGVEEEVGVTGAPGPSAQAAPNVLGEPGNYA